MNEAQMMQEVQRIIDDAKTAVLATVDDGSVPHMRWVTPALLNGHPRSIFMITSPAFAKTHHVKKHPSVTWMFQTRALDRIVNLAGTMFLLDNPSIQSEVLEAVGPRLRTFWRVSIDTHSLVVLETSIETATLFLPGKATKETVTFSR